MNGRYRELQDFMQGLRVVNTHCHHQPDVFFEDDFGLNNIIEKSYAAWCGYELGATDKEREIFIINLKHRSFFFWLERALRELYGITEELSAETFSLFDEKIRETYQKDKGRHISLMKEACGYDKVILDAYWDTGSTCGHPELFSATFRVDSYMVAYDRDKTDHDDNNASAAFGIEFENTDAVIAHIEQKLAEGKQKGVVAIKCATAYDRGVDFEPASKERASKVFKVSRENRRKEDEKAYEDYLFHEVCALAGGMKLPFQIHTGLGALGKTNAMQLLPAIQSHPDTKFVLFHGGYPWTDDVLGLAHLFPNQIYPDLCWLPLISPGKAESFIAEIVDIVQSGALCWGCDSWTAEESYGALLAARHVLAKTFSAKIEDGIFSVADACDYIKGIMYDNAKALYF